MLAAPVPAPHVVKDSMLLAHAKHFGLKTLVATGMFNGDMMYAMWHHFAKLNSIELSPELHTRTKGRSAKTPNIELIQGESAVELGKLIPGLTEPALFRFDCHFSAGETASGDKHTPVMEELNALLGSPLALFIIDDARCFGTDPRISSHEPIRVTAT
ncbi:MAG: hypothetical protein IPK97_06905 [Ahniella sp.]|nr:hypothetical protein [Ahniella sp.]